MTEVWREIKEHPNYEVSSYGNVRYKESRELMKLRKRKTGNYVTIYVELDGKLKNKVSRIVAKAFPDICGKWFDTCQVHHKDIDSSNNKCTNLQVCTVEEHRAIHHVIGKRHYKKELAKKELAKPEPKPTVQVLVKPDISNKIIYQYTKHGEYVRGYLNSKIIMNFLGAEAWEGIKKCCLKEIDNAYGYKWSLASPSIEN